MPWKQHRLETMSMSSFEGRFTDFPTKGRSKFSLRVARFCSSFETFKLSRFQSFFWTTIVNAFRVSGSKISLDLGRVSVELGGF